jgi:hypothetical protein
MRGHESEVGMHLKCYKLQILQGKSGLVDFDGPIMLSFCSVEGCIDIICNGLRGKLTEIRGMTMQRGQCAT